MTILLFRYNHSDLFKTLYQFGIDMKMGFYINTRGYKNPRLNRLYYIL